MNRNAVIIVVLVILVIIAGVILLAAGGTKTPAVSPSPTQTPSPSLASATTLPSATPSGAAALSGATVSFDGNGFTVSPSTMKAGGTLTVVNHSNGQLEFDSDPHPAHTDEPELNLGQISPGSSKSVRVTKPGTWGFHNHLNPSQHGQITVQ